MPNPLALGIDLGGLLLDVIAPRPKPRYGYVLVAVPRTAQEPARTEQYEATVGVSG